jgi:hypothetical protein
MVVNAIGMRQEQQVCFDYFSAALTYSLNANFMQKSAKAHNTLDFHQCGQIGRNRAFWAFGSIFITKNWLDFYFGQNIYFGSVVKW